MAMRGDVVARDKSRLERIVTSGVRMERMIQQILDITRARLSDGIPIVRSAHKQDMASLVRKIVEETRAAHPARVIELEVSATCLACVDGDRLEQVVSNLLGNAITHGDPSLPIRVTVGLREHLGTISVKNYGASL
jgi:two-component system, sensor histidine kinase and response regulator